MLHELGQQKLARVTVVLAWMNADLLNQQIVASLLTMPQMCVDIR